MSCVHSLMVINFLILSIFINWSFYFFEILVISNLSLKELLKTIPRYFI